MQCDELDKDEIFKIIEKITKFFDDLMDEHRYTNVETQ